MTSRVNWFTPDRAKDWRTTDVAAARVIDTTQEIADDSTSIVVVRAGVSQAAQTVRLCQPERGGKGASEGGTAAVADVIVLGAAALNIQREDTFLVSGSLYRVIYVAPLQNNRKEAHAVQVQ